MSKTPPFSEWLKIMLDEIECRHEEAVLAKNEQARRSTHDKTDDDEQQSDRVDSSGPRKIS